MRQGITLTPLPFSPLLIRSEKRLADVLSGEESPTRRQILYEERLARVKTAHNHTHRLIAHSVCSEREVVVVAAWTPDRDLKTRQGG